jgi:hypothetical protein
LRRLTSSLQAFKVLKAQGRHGRKFLRICAEEFDIRSPQNYTPLVSALLTYPPFPVPQESTMTLAIILFLIITVPGTLVYALFEYVDRQK